MRIVEPNSAATNFLSRPLCRRYAVIVLTRISTLPVKAEADQSRTFCWAYGTLINGDAEVLGAWNSDGEQPIPVKVFGNLRDRGVEFVAHGVGNLIGAESAFMGTFGRAMLLPSIEQSVASTVAAVKPAHRAAVSNLLRAALGDADRAPSSVAPDEISRAVLRERYPKLLRQWDEAVAPFQPVAALPEPYRSLVRSADRTAFELHERLMKAIHRHGPFVDSVEAFDFVASALMRADRQYQRGAREGRLARSAVAMRSGLVPGRLRGVGVPTLAERVSP